MEVISLKEKYFACLTYLVIKDDKCLIIDAGASIQTIKNAIIKHNITKICGVLVTHAHFDHMYGLESYAQEFDCNIFISKKGIKNLKDPVANHSYFVDCGAIKFESDKVLVPSTKKFKLADFDVEMISTPGHTDDGSCYVVDNEVMFTGDTLFYYAVGRTDLLNSSNSDLINSLKKLRKYDKFKNYYAGHGKSFTSSDMVTYLKSLGIF